ncbi:MAG: hypothetical protein DME46_01600 [Verrucomicrobia bacterium]|nr:MAG: hypothetical protein DME46_01600 [Verrucomicrobiota bacterium]
MANDEGMTKTSNPKLWSHLFRHLIIRHSFELRHSGFVVGAKKHGGLARRAAKSAGSMTSDE